MIEPPDEQALRNVNDVEQDEFPRFASVIYHRDLPELQDVAAAARETLDEIPVLDQLEAGAEIGITAGSRGIHDMPTILRAVTDELVDRGFSPFVFPAMGSHGGATAEGQVETLASVGITEESIGCEIHASMDVTAVDTDEQDRPVYAADDALAADAVLLANRVKLHTDFSGDIESGLCKMAVIGVGKQRGADAAHDAALDSSFREVIPERTEILVTETPIIGGVAVVENARERAAYVEGVPATNFLEREPELLELAAELQPMLPVEDFDLLILDEIGKNISGTGMDTNVVGRMNIHGEPEFDSPSITRIYIRSLTEEAHGNANGIGLADFAHKRAIRSIHATPTYVNSVTGGQPERGRIPPVAPSDLTALLLAFSTLGTTDPGDMRIARIQNTLEPDELLVSEPIAEELKDHPDVTVGELRPLEFRDGNFGSEPWESDD